MIADKYDKKKKRKRKYFIYFYILKNILKILYILTPI